MVNLFGELYQTSSEYLSDLYLRYFISRAWTSLSAPLVASASWSTTFARTLPTPCGTSTAPGWTIASSEPTGTQGSSKADSSVEERVGDRFVTCLIQNLSVPFEIRLGPKELDGPSMGPCPLVVKLNHSHLLIKWRLKLFSFN